MDELSSNSNDDFLFHIIDTDVVLPFTSVERTAAGRYTCSASNIVNGQTLSASDSTSVRVICEYSIDCYAAFLVILLPSFS